MSDLGPMPKPQAEPKEPEPGGADAVEYEEVPDDSRAARDLDPEDNPAVDDVPTEATEPDADKQQAPDASAEPDPDESPGEDPPSEPSA